jgi:hypothetical protein
LAMNNRTPTNRGWNHEDTSGFLRKKTIRRQ